MLLLQGQGAAGEDYSTHTRSIRWKPPGSTYTTVRGSRDYWYTRTFYLIYTVHILPVYDFIYVANFLCAPTSAHNAHKALQQEQHARI